MAQTLMGHGGFSQYRFRFKLRDSPHCACDPAKIQDVLLVLEDCDMFLRKRAALEAGIGVQIVRRNFTEILEEAIKREKFFDFCDTVVKRFSRTNKQARNRRACMKRLMEVSETSETCKDRTTWKFIVSEGFLRNRPCLSECEKKMKTRDKIFNQDTSAGRAARRRRADARAADSSD
ncbi:hypothetical protein EVAR_2941_1 [Eumeta japonica]|uniref:Uncharacterized protein n=1 Tax=Eumeta variegata TaxID=151549 RepID=A0A4C1T1U8_EUMVA|nr:hypothetical protein EVAR_2941_1 [Eumeta japonica]